MKYLNRKMALMGMIASLGLAMPAMASPGGEQGMQRQQAGERMAEALNLSDAQKQQIEAIRSEAKPGMKSLGDAMRANREALRKLNPDDAKYMSEVERLAAEKGSLVQQMVIAHAKMRASIHQVLTPEQRVKAQELAAKRGDRRGKNRWPGRGMGAPE